MGGLWTGGGLDGECGLWVVSHPNSCFIWPCSFAVTNVQEILDAQVIEKALELIVMLDEEGGSVNNGSKPGLKKRGQNVTQPEDITTASSSAAWLQPILPASSSACKSKIEHIPSGPVLAG